MSHNAIDSLYEAFGDDPSVAAICQAIREKSPIDRHKEHTDLYRKAIAFLEERLWSDDPDDTSIELYQKLFQELESRFSAQENSLRHNFIVIIPVADRPQHLNNCLDSLLELCKRFDYGGFNNNTYTKISVLIADDSKQTENILKHRETAELFTHQGLRTRHFGQSEQLEIIDGLNKTTREQLSNIIGEIDHAAFYHKGASLMRNITYLKLLDLMKDQDRLLFFFIDSDQEFKIRSNSKSGAKNLYALNYFYYLDQIFSTTATQVLTGKVVGDPPVSPAVMAGNFLEDVIAFLTQMAKLEPNQACQFHDGCKEKTDDASYHDMADLFGFSPAIDALPYHCPVTGEHVHAASFSHFSNQLERFFYGEHPTRKTSYEPADITAGITPARTVYTGNYIFKPEALRFFIPFAPLKLRMAGPVLGRLIKTEINDHFVSANLPMLHQRTVVESGKSEFRPGIHRRTECIDLSGEYERQFFGDVMLFSMERLITLGYPKQSVTLDSIQETVRLVEKSLYEKYTEKRRQILQKLQELRLLVNDQANWWNNLSELEDSVQYFTRFMHNIEYNFADEAMGFQLISDKIHKEHRLTEISKAIAQYPRDSQSWRSLMDEHCA